MNSKEKNLWRQRKVWKEFRSTLGKQRKVDELTGTKLYKRFNLHHMIMTDSEEIYTNLSNPDNFMCLNTKTHDFLHFAFDQQRKDPEFLNRFNQAVLKMIKLTEENE